MEVYPFVSIVTATYQTADHLPQCIESVLGQTYPNTRMEFILVDDASTDATQAVASRYDDPRFRYVRLSSNRGPSIARNCGINLASGDLIAFIDADDYWFPDRLSKMIPSIRTETDLVTTDFYYEDFGVVSGESAYRGRNLEWLFDLSSEQQLRALLEDNFLACSMMMVPRKVLDRVGLFNESLRACQDGDLWLRCLSAGSRVVCTLEPLGVYRRMRPGSITATESQPQILERLTVLKPYFHLCSRQRASKIRGDAAYAALRRSVLSGRYPDTLKAALALVSNPSYLGHKLRARFAGGGPTSARTPLTAFRDRLRGF